MDQNNLSHIQLWCPRPFGTYSQNKQYIEKENKVKKLFVSKFKVEESEEGGYCENTPPDAPPPAPPPPPPNSNQAEDARVLLDTWYVIKPGNTKEKVAFFVAHQCSGGGRASAVKVKGNWGTDNSKAKRRRRSYDPNKSRASQLNVKEDSKAEDVCLCAKQPQSSLSPESSSQVDDADLLSVAEMVALVEQRTALALQNYSRPYPVGPQTSVPGSDPMVVVSNHEQEEEIRTSDSNRVAEAVAHFESQQQRERNGMHQNSVCKESGLSTSECVANSQHSPGEVRIAFRISSREARASSEGSSSSRPNCVFMGCGGSSNGTRSKDKITCDLYQLVSPSCDTLPNNVEYLLANAGQKADGCGSSTSESSSMEMAGEGKAATGKTEIGSECRSVEKLGAMSRDCMAGFHVDVVVTGVVDQCVFFGKDSTKNMKEETVCLTVGAPSQESQCATCNDPPPGQLFFLQAPRLEDGKDVDNSLLDSQNNNGPGCERMGGNSSCGTEQDASDASLCRLYRHVSHDFLEIRFKIQRLLEPRQYMLLLPDHIMVNIFSYLPTQSLAALKCTCHYFKCIIEAYSIQATDSKWNRDPLYREDPCKQCKKVYERGDVSLCRWHPKPYHHDLPYGRSYWMCCRQTDKDTPGCRVGLHDNNWVQPCDMLRDRARREDGR
ncbi:F-box only protein 46 [Ambystoma mexicanum]|uniref:F-box only protein 46 n=1 Tax=Ambystoma mexicanum TaxID=8296 RepID=UPI0037E9C6D5